MTPADGSAIHEKAQQRPATATAAPVEDKPVVVFDHVRLAFDDKVVLKDISFTVRSGRTKIILGASGSGKSTILKIIVGLFRSDAGQIFVNGERTDQMTEDQMMKARA